MITVLLYYTILYYILYPGVGDHHGYEDGGGGQGDYGGSSGADYGGGDFGGGGDMGGGFGGD